MIESDKSQSRISRSIRARTASLPDKIKFIEISRAPTEIMLPEFCDKPNKAFEGPVLRTFRPNGLSR
jgi:hypothetical protein